MKGNVAAMPNGGTNAQNDSPDRSVSSDASASPDASVTSDESLSKVTSLSQAVEHVRAGDAVHLMCSHTRWSALARALVRAWWGRDPEWTLVMLSLSSLGAIFFPFGEHRGLVRKVITGYSGDVFPNFTPNPRFSAAYLSGAVEVEHWSFLAFTQRMEAAARGLPAVTTNSLKGSSMAENSGYAEIESPFGEIGLLEAFAPDIALVHAAVADHAGNLAFHPPMLEGVWGALAARRGVVASAEIVVDDITPYAHLVKVPSHQVLAVCEIPMGAHPGGLFGTYTAAQPYAEDLEFWNQARTATHGSDVELADWIDRWVLSPETQAEYLDLLGPSRLDYLRDRADRESWRADAAENPPDLAAPANSWEAAAVNGARALAMRISETDADVVLAGAGVANLATWLGVELARQQGCRVELTAELGLLGYEPTPSDPYVFNHRAFPSSEMIGDAQEVLGRLVPGPGTTCLACLGAAQIDSAGNINSTRIGDKVFLVGSGGGNDVATAADDVIVVTTLTDRRTVEAVPYITSPGLNVSVIATDLCVLERRDGRFVAVSIAAGMEDSVADRLAWELEIAPDCTEMAAPTPQELARLRGWDPSGVFLRP